MVIRGVTSSPFIFFSSCNAARPHDFFPLEALPRLRRFCASRRQASSFVSGGTVDCKWRVGRSEGSQAPADGLMDNYYAGFRGAARHHLSLVTTSRYHFFLLTSSLLHRHSGKWWRAFYHFPRPASPFLFAVVHPSSRPILINTCVWRSVLILRPLLLFLSFFSGVR